ncbi:unnamed protein product, partial [Heterotrigona itama]
STPDLLPALLLIHGDSYSWGTGNSFDGTALAAYGRLIVVSINIRLGVLVRTTDRCSSIFQILSSRVDELKRDTRYKNHKLQVQPKVKCR